METEMISALDDIEPSKEESLISIAAFAPPSLAGSQYKQLELLQHLSLYSELLILISAEHGMGKTFIAKALLASREAPEQNLMLEADFSLSYIDILHKLAQFFDLAEPSADLESIENQIITHCMQLADEEQGSMLLIIDKADQLADETLEDLNNLALLAPNAFHLMLLATPQFEDKLIDLSEPQAPVHVMEIDPLTEKEAEVLLLQYFPEKEWSGEQVEYILQQGVGNPGKILYIAQQLIAGKNPANKPQSVVAKYPITHIAAMLLIASALVMSYLYQSSKDELELDTSIEAPIAIEFIQAPLVNEKEIVKDSVEINSNNELPITDAEVDFNFVESDGVNALSASDTPSDKPQEKSADVIVVNENVLSIKKQITSAKNQAVASNAVKTELTAKVSKSYSVGEKKLLAADAGSFVIQLFGSYSQKNATDFATTYSSKSTRLITYQTQHKGKPWHVVVAGPYANRSTAASQSKYFPEKLRKQNLWVRSVEPIQALITSEK